MPAIPQLRPAQSVQSLLMARLGIRQRLGEFEAAGVGVGGRHRIPYGHPRRPALHAVDAPCRAAESAFLSDLDLLRVSLNRSS
jgi:hypothetical protein